MQTSKIAQTVTDLVKRREALAAETAQIDAEINAIRSVLGLTTGVDPDRLPGLKFLSTGVPAKRLPTKVFSPRYTGEKAKKLVEAFQGHEFLRYRDLAPILLNPTVYAGHKDGLIVKVGPGRFSLSAAVKAANGLV